MVTKTPRHDRIQPRQEGNRHTHKNAQGGIMRRPLQKIRDRFRQTADGLDSLDCVLLDNVSDGILLLDTEHAVRRANQVAERLFALTRDELCGRPFCSLIQDPACNAPDCDRASCAVIGSLRAIDNSANSLHWHTRGLRADGQTFAIELEASWLSHGSDQGYVLFVRDRDEQRLLEARLKRLEMEMNRLENRQLEKSRFFAYMTHELRTPLNTILGYTELMLDDLRQQDASAELMTDMDNIQCAGRHMLKLVNELLDLSRLEAGQTHLNLESFEVGTLIARAVRSLQPLFDSNGNQVSMRTNLSNQTVHSDTTKLHQILLNLLSNANKFTRNGSIAIEISACRRGDAAGIAIEVSDTGIGMSQDQIDALFHDFAQATDDIAKHYGGTGLGLSISKRYCEMMGGEISVRSAPGAGSIFRIWLPCEAGSAGTRAAARPEQIRLADGDARRQRIASVLVIDTDPVASERTARLLANDGFRALSTRKPEAAIQLIEDTRPDIIVLDVMMPDADGWSLLQAIRLNPAAALTPVIAHTALSDHDLTLSLGASDHVMKYADQAQLLIAVKKWVRRIRKDRVMLLSPDPALRLDLAIRLKKQGYCTDRPLHAAQALQCLERRLPALIVLEARPDSEDWQPFLDTLAAHKIWREIPVLTLALHSLPDSQHETLGHRTWRVIRRAEAAAEHVWTEIHDCLQELAQHPEGARLQPNAPV